VHARPTILATKLLVNGPDVRQQGLAAVAAAGSARSPQESFAASLAAAAPPSEYPSQRCVAQAHCSPLTRSGKEIDSLRKRLLWAMTVDALEPSRLHYQQHRPAE
jgi:hypothetical protein